MDLLEKSSRGEGGGEGERLLLGVATEALIQLE